MQLCEEPVTAFCREYAQIELRGTAIGYLGCGAGAQGYGTPTLHLSYQKSSTTFPQFGITTPRYILESLWCYRTLNLVLVQSTVWGTFIPYPPYHTTESTWTHDHNKHPYPRVSLQLKETALLISFETR